jgi:hypothetical protein
MLSIISSVLTGFLGPTASAVSSYFTAKNDAERQVALAAYTLAASAAGQFLVVFYGMTVGIYFAKCLLWDKVLADFTHGSTDPVTGDMATLMWIVVGFIFGHGIIGRLKG